MCTKIGSVGESSLAVRAFVRLFSGVGSDVSLEQPRSAERLTANFALAWKRVRSNVHFKCAERHVEFVTVFAMEWPLVVGMAVVLLMAK